MQKPPPRWLTNSLSFVNRFWLRGNQFILWLGAAFFFLGGFVALTEEMLEKEHLGKDQAVLNFVESFRVPALNGIAVDLTALGSVTVITILTVIGTIFLLLKKDRRGALYLLLGALGAGVWTIALKHIISRERPTEIPRLVEVAGYSYPSGHSLGATSVYLLLMFIAFRNFQTIKAKTIIFVVAAMLIIGVCFSRVYLGVHYPSDVLSGALLGTSWVLFLTAFLGNFKTYA